MRYFCTYFDARYLSRGLAMYRSLARHCPAFRLYVLCLNDTCYDALNRAALPHLVPIRLPDLEQFDPALAAVRARRRRVEYYFTLTPSLPLFILAADPEIDLITYIDADILFFSTPEPIYSELGDQSILIIGHRFSERNAHRAQYGRYNVGWVTWRNDRQGRACLDTYRERCLEWCYAFLENGRFADQRYLDAWPETFSRLVEARHRGCNVAPWNIDTDRLMLRDGQVFVDDDRLIFYHFHALKSTTELDLSGMGIDEYVPNLAGLDRTVIFGSIYLPYLLALADARAEIETLGFAEPETVEAAVQVPLWRDSFAWSHQVSEAPAWNRLPEIDPHRALACRADARAEAERDAGAARRVDPGGRLLDADAVRELILDRVFRDAVDGGPLDVLDWGGARAGLPALSLARRRRGTRTLRYRLLDAPVPAEDLAEAYPGLEIVRSLADALREPPRVILAGARVSECADWPAILALLRGSGVAWIVLDVHTTTDHDGLQARRRVCGSASVRPIWVHKRRELAEAFGRLGLAVADEYVWSDSVYIQGCVESIDHRTIVLRREGSDRA
ncbi:hypothetical protein MKK69_04810 [Methylobacterium sp. J-026]|uniref:hypothetical protein n=1 Tax=Methylobacterium sp. J-026 TaxID=2836624 RepID=UPI001FB91E6F|nr:hypothetical protein [Methylobacterium sp. J-026]MCJ2133388.1 hypothetical protein [Methylobacterium sp. J-026]